MSTSDTYTTQASALQKLAFFASRWKANGTFFATPTSGQKVIEMTIHGTYDLENNWLLLHTQENPTPENSHPLSAIYIWGYDLSSQQFLASWFDSNGGRATQTSSGWDGDQLVFLGEMTVAGQMFPLRDTFVKKGEDTYYHVGEAYFQEQWVPVDEETVSREGEKL